MSWKSMIIIGLVAVGPCAGCATGMGVGGASGNGQAAPRTDVPSCGGGTSYNRASGLCVGPSGP
jgi:hypothetical protein